MSAGCRHRVAPRSGRGRRAARSAVSSDAVAPTSLERYRQAPGPKGGSRRGRSGDREALPDREVACRAMRAWPALVALLAAGCGGGTAAAPTVTAPEPPITTTTAATTAAATTATATATTTPPPATSVQRADLKFPATTATEVLALAGQRPTGVASYQVTVTGGDTTAGVSYGVELASDDTHARIHQTQDTGQTWIGLDLTTN